LIKKLNKNLYVIKMNSIISLLELKHIFDIVKDITNDVFLNISETKINISGINNGILLNIDIDANKCVKYSWSNDLNIKIDPFLIYKKLCEEWKKKFKYVYFGITNDEIILKGVNNPE